MSAQTYPIAIMREQIRAITSIEVNGEIHNLGEHRDFRRHDTLASFIPESGRISFAWVRLRDGEILDIHQHPTKSMILVCNGSVQVIGDLEQNLVEGDVICVPPYKKHGFRTQSGEVFHGLSVQFEGEGLYEDEHNARVSFEDISPSLKALEQLNAARCEKHTKGVLFELLKTGNLSQDSELFGRFISALYVWSTYFQRILHARQALCVNEDLKEEYSQHLHEEYGHDRLLLTQHPVDKNVYDPILEAACNWFVSSMYQLDEAEKIVVVHMVIESSGHAFGLATSSLFGDKNKGKDYFKVHAEADEDHCEIGQDYLKTLPISAFPRLMNICQKAWDQMDLIHDRITAWTLYNREA